MCGPAGVDVGHWAVDVSLPPSAAACSRRADRRAAAGETSVAPEKTDSLARKSCHYHPSGMSAWSCSLPDNQNAADHVPFETRRAATTCKRRPYVRDLGRMVSALAAKLAGESADTMCGLQGHGNDTA